MENEPETTHLYLIRHGQAVSNVEPIIAGRKGDAGLTPLGVAQAERLRDRLAATGEITPDVFLSSSLPRARQTAEIIAPALGLLPTLDDELHEMRPGDEADGLPLDEYKRRFGWVDLETEPERPIDPGGESWVTFTARVSRVLSRITTEHAGKTIAAVAHGGVIDVSFLHFFQMPLGRVPPASFFTHNTSITHWEFDARSKRQRWRLVKYNDDAHLAGLAQGEVIDWATIKPAAAPDPGAEKSAAPVPTEPDGDAPAAGARAPGGE